MSHSKKIEKEMSSYHSPSNLYPFLSSIKYGKVEETVCGRRGENKRPIEEVRWREGV